MTPAEVKAMEDSHKMRSKLVQEYEEQAEYAEETANELFGSTNAIPDVFNASMHERMNHQV